MSRYFSRTQNLPKLASAFSNHEPVAQSSQTRWKRLYEGSYSKGERYRFGFLWRAHADLSRSNIMQKRGSSRVSMASRCPFWPIDFSKAATFWIPLSEVNEFNGGLKFSQDYEAKKHAAVNLHTGVKQDGTPDLNLMKFTRPRCIPETYSSLAQQYFMHRALDSVQKSECSFICFC